MTRLIIPSFAALVLLAFQSPSLPGPGGQYVCTGVSDGHPYTLHLIVAAHDGHYRLLWRTPQGEPVHSGLGLVEGEVLSVVFGNAQGVALASYRIRPDELAGRWTDGVRVEHESCKREKAPA